MPTVLTKARTTFSYNKLPTSLSIREAKAMQPSTDIPTRLRSSRTVNRLRILNGLGNVKSVLGSQKVRSSMSHKFTYLIDVIEFLDLLKMLDWICVYLLEKSFERVQQLQKQGQSSFDVRNNSQVFHAINLAQAYGQRAIFNTFVGHVLTIQPSPERDVLTKLLSLYGSNLILKNYLGIMYEGGFVQSGFNAAELLQSGILNVLPQLKNEAISLIDAIAPPDFIVNSPLGMSDGRIYDHLKSVIYQTSDTFHRPNWWKDIVKSKL